MARNGHRAGQIQFGQASPAARKRRVRRPADIGGDRPHRSQANLVPEHASYRSFLEDLPMSDAVKVGFVPFSAAPRGVLVVFCDETMKFGPATQKALGKAVETVKRAAAASRFKGKSGSALDILAPE